MRKTLKDKHHELMLDSEYAKEFAVQEDEFQIARALIHARKLSGLTQKQVAERMGTTQSAVARMESGKPLPSMKSLKRYAMATGCKVKIAFEPCEPTELRSTEAP